MPHLPSCDGPDHAHWGRCSQGQRHNNYQQGTPLLDCSLIGKSVEQRHVRCAVVIHTKLVVLTRNACLQVFFDISIGGKAAGEQLCDRAGVPVCGSCETT